MNIHLPRAPRLVASCALGLLGLAVGCGSSETTTSTSTASSSTSSSTTGAGGGSGGAGGGGGSGDGGAGGAAAVCPPGSHPGAIDCAADLKDWTAGPKLAHKRDHH